MLYDLGTSSNPPLVTIANNKQVLQVMLHISRMYSHLEQVALRSVHSMKSNTPLLDAMVMFQREFKVIKEANSVEALRSQLTQQELEQYGDAVTPQYVYDAIAKVDRFNSMRVSQTYALL